MAVSLLWDKRAFDLFGFVSEVSSVVFKNYKGLKRSVYEHFFVLRQLSYSPNIFVVKLANLSKIKIDSRGE